MTKAQDPLPPVGAETHLAAFQVVQTWVQGCDFPPPFHDLARLHQVVAVALTTERETHRQEVEALQAELESCRQMLHAVVGDRNGLWQRVVTAEASLAELVEACDWYAQDTYDREPPHQLGAYGAARKVLAVVKRDV